ncbi:MAG TPA: ATP-binding protein [Planctomycetota bacterium]|jgi:signal transduction histidine kinase|nr:ATP-binding protein [Planctomycetota bacterium]MDP7246546.1 ATP-binding protein [Planctomycetota bacterium]MDP7558920.1 ATP-binding protein [Planctomycetota bacterium]HJM38661.1 ATP-binding protein [Planctomycetota bacterium]|tara:strand:- start:31436 stop:32149 length:714 start_codon:yes stop_codon:yes gene_type:complete
MKEVSNSNPPLDPQTLSRLAGGLAHELKNPLSTIGLHLDILRENWSGETEPLARRTLKTLDVLKQEVGRLNDILEDFLLYARTETMERSSVDFNALVEKVATFVAPEAQAQGIRLDTFLDGSLPLLSLDEGRIRQALLNLLINARQAMEGEGGSISLITRVEEDTAILEIVDDGPGMDSKTAERCMDVYYSSKKGGSGLGLPTVRRILEAHEGALQLESSPGHGTRARMILPIGRDS